MREAFVSQTADLTRVNINRDIEPIVEWFGTLAGREVAMTKERSEALKRELGKLTMEGRRLEQDIGAARASQATLSGDRARLQTERIDVAQALRRAQGDQKTSEAEAERRRQERALLEKRQSATVVEQAEIAKRLSSIQSPFGSLPVGIREGLLSFPLVVAVAYLIAAGSLARAVRLRGTWHRLLRKRMRSVNALCGACSQIFSLWGGKGAEGTDGFGEGLYGAYAHCHGRLSGPHGSRVTIAKGVCEVASNRSRSAPGRCRSRWAPTDASLLW